MDDDGDDEVTEAEFSNNFLMFINDLPITLWRVPEVIYYGADTDEDWYATKEEIAALYLALGVTTVSNVDIEAFLYEVNKDKNTTIFNHLDMQDWLTENIYLASQAEPSYEEILGVMFDTLNTEGDETLDHTEAVEKVNSIITTL